LERPHADAVRQRHSGELPGNLATEEEVYQLINHPGRIETAELARQLIEWLENASAGIQAQLDSHNERARGDWGRRAAYALSIKRSRLERLERRLAQLDGTMQSPVQRKLANAQANVEAARIASASRAEMRRQTAQATRENNAKFVAAAKAMLTREQYSAIWARARQPAATGQLTSDQEEK